MNTQADGLSDNQLLRYSRHILLEPFGIEAQRKLASATVLVIGAGGLGSAALLYLASSGVGRIVIADGDKVDLTNLQRQVVHDEASIGVNKAASAKARLAVINSTIAIDVIAERLDEASLTQWVSQADIVLDCTDNFSTRHAINRAAFLHRKILVSGAAIRFDGQVTSFDFRDSSAPCYACLFPEDDEAEEERCAVMGVFAPLVGVIGAMQAAEALRLLTGLAETSDQKQSVVGRLQLFDARSFNWRDVRYRKDAGCRVCGGLHQQAAKTILESHHETAHA